MVLFSRIFADAKFCENKPPRNVELMMLVNHATCIVAHFFLRKNISFNAIRENKFLAKFSEFTVIISRPVSV